MLSKFYNKLFKSAYNFSIMKTIIYNIINYKIINLKLYLGKRTSIINRGGNLEVDEKAYIDSKNGGQFFYDSHIVLEHNSKLKFGNNVNFFSGAQIKCFENSSISIGDNTYFSGPVTMHSKEEITIGSNCSISWGVTIIDSDFHSIDDKAIKSSKVIIGDNVWIGCNVTILKGVKIVDGSIIAAGSVMTKSTTQKGVYAGNPARLVKVLDEK
jgi:acetyltransferase-like isoleucine patch superfamily enzyme